jgi:ADP-ribosyl-[dinitrogen reductase] hydrolase
MPTNTALLCDLLDRGQIALQPAPLLEAPPPPLPADLDYSRVEGMMLGLAVGDALGNTSESQNPDERERTHGEIRDYLPNRHAGDLPYGLPSDDSQLAFWTLESLLARGGLDPEDLLQRFAGERIYGIGRAMRECVERYRRGVRPWHACAARSAGNGALMRIAPVLIPHLRAPSPALWADAALAARATHDDLASTAACVAWIGILWRVLGMSRPPEPTWWLDAYVEVARALEGESRYEARGGAYLGYEGPVWRFAAERVAEAYERGLSVREACDAWYSGAYLLETVPTVLYILMRHAADPEEAIVRAVNDTRDNDTVAAIVGSAVGALHGRQGLPLRWLDGLSGRTRQADSGHVFALLAEARLAFWESVPSPVPADPPVPVVPIVEESAMPRVTETTPERPNNATYWVLPGRFLAGEYPGAYDEGEARERLRAYLHAGVDLFIDLTEAGEYTLKPYDHLLTEVAKAMGRPAEHRRMPIRDVSVPTTAFMREILDTMDAALAAGRTVYVHCWGGIGRTGTVVGCWHVRHGWPGEQALERVQALFDTTRKAGRPSPEAVSQENMVRAWAENDRPTLRGRFRGAMLGLAAGDALGTTIEFSPRGARTVTDIVGGGPFSLPPGAWTDDTSMALCLAESLVERGGFDPRDQMARYLRWYDEGYLSSTGRCFDIGSTTSQALRRFASTGEPYAGSTAGDKAGNGSLMRLAPVPLAYFRDAEEALARAADSSRTTHGARAALDACRFYAGLIVGALRGEDKGALLSERYAPIPGYWEEHPLCPEVDAIAAGSYRAKDEPEISASGYVVHTLEAALWALYHTDDFREGCLRAVNLGQDADTTGAVYGQLAGAFYGEEGIPEGWRRILVRADLITGLADGLYRMATARPFVR